ncbi:hypothetical protein CCR75_004854 [Bremia lactucae]|uniref:Secreted protein n=1 Tax=Bremia lactucae TaxID=4779 RepID=A0A976ICJ2_BRELC|nr:hypothetical protein CCR75_004854 [Bremia lactucae]
MLKDSASKIILLMRMIILLIIKRFISPQCEPVALKTKIKPCQQVIFAGQRSSRLFRTVPSLMRWTDRYGTLKKMEERTYFHLKLMT